MLEERISCPGVFLPDKEVVYLGVYLLNQYLETDCFPSVFPIVIQQSMRFEKVFEEALDPGAVAELLESFLTRFELVQLVSPAWEELAYYEKNTRDFLFPEPKLTASHLGMQREVLMKTAIWFPGELLEAGIIGEPRVVQQVVNWKSIWRHLSELKFNTVILVLWSMISIFETTMSLCHVGIAPKLEFSTRTAILECVFPCKNRFFSNVKKGVNCKGLSRNRMDSESRQITGKRSQRRKTLTNSPKAHSPGDPPLHVSISIGQLSATLEKALSSREKGSLHLWLDIQALVAHVYNSSTLGRQKQADFLVRGQPGLQSEVDSGNPFGENNLEHHSQRSRRKPKLINFDLSKRRASSLDSLEANIKVIREPDERIVLRSHSPPRLDSIESRKPLLSPQGDVDFHPETSVITSQISRPPSPLDQSLLQERKKA
ncbi:Spermatogenesis-associated 6-like protein [Apodemus speciosus]|uniref:Spermatogenesis-associated 6-like protein n=1 Tax=Apodemus speciosus TaxID=105296 RepID=A0ABQ0FSS4_APOSI